MNRREVSASRMDHSLIMPPLRAWADARRGGGRGTLEEDIAAALLSLTRVSRASILNPPVPPNLGRAANAGGRTRGRTGISGIWPFFIVQDLAGALAF